MSAIDVYGYASVDVTDDGDVTLTIGGDDVALSTAAARKLADVLVKASAVAEATYSAQVKRAKLEAQVRKLQEDMERKLAALASL